jgi:hypothetical protein
VKETTMPHLPIRRGPVILTAFSVLYLAATGLLAARAPLWYDELFTFHLARLPHLADLWHALAAGTDATPPLYHLLTRLAQQALGQGELATRLPAVAGYWVMSVSLYAFVARRCRRAYAVTAMLFPLATAVYPWAYNARPYGMVLGCCGLALVCWQAAADGRRRPLALTGLALSLAAAVASHYYAFLLLAPFAVGEAWRTRTRRRVDLPVWLALAAGPVVLAALLPLALGARRGMTPFGFAPGWDSIEGTYLFLLKYTRWPLLAVLALAALYPERGQRRADAGPPAHEVVAALTLAALPVLGVCLSQWVTHFYAARYAMPAVLGAAVLLAFVADRRTAGSLPLALVLSALFLGRCAQATWRDYRQLGEVRAGIARANALLERHGDGNLPIAIDDPFTFLQLVHYAPAPLRARLVYLSNPEAARRHNCHDPRDWCLRQLRQWADVPVRDYGSFIAAHRHFLVYGDTDWLRRTLEADGVRCRPCTAPAAPPLFEAGADAAEKESQSGDARRTPKPPFFETPAPAGGKLKRRALRGIVPCGSATCSSWPWWRPASSGSACCSTRPTARRGPTTSTPARSRKRTSAPRSPGSTRPWTGPWPRPSCGRPRPRPS